MTPLRAQMIDAMQMRGFSPRTHQSYLAAVAGLAGFYHRSPDTLTPEEVRAYFTYLVITRQLAPASCRVALHGVRFLFLTVLERAEFDVPIPLPKRPQRIPELLTRKEIARLLAATSNPKEHALLATGYGCGLRVTELVGLKVRHIDGERGLLRVDHSLRYGKSPVWDIHLVSGMGSPVWDIHLVLDPGHPLAYTTAHAPYQGFPAMTAPRSVLVCLEDTPYYHVYSRVVET